MIQYTSVQVVKKANTSYEYVREKGMPDATFTRHLDKIVSFLDHPRLSSEEKIDLSFFRDFMDDRTKNITRAYSPEMVLETMVQIEIILKNNPFLTPPRYKGICRKMDVDIQKASLQQKARNRIRSAFVASEGEELGLEFTEKKYCLGLITAGHQSLYVTYKVGNSKKKDLLSMLKNYKKIDLRSGMIELYEVERQNTKGIYVVDSHALVDLSKPSQYRKGDRIDYVIDYDDVAAYVQEQIESIEKQAQYALKNDYMLVYCKAVS